MKFDKSQELYPSSQDYKDAMKDGRIHRDMNSPASHDSLDPKSLTSKPSKPVSNKPMPTFNSTPSDKKVLRKANTIIVTLVILGNALFHFLTPRISEVTTHQPTTEAENVIVLESPLTTNSHLTSDRPLEVYRIATNTTALGDNPLNQEKTQFLSAGLYANNHAYLKLSYPDYNADLILLSKLPLDKAYKNHFFNVDGSLKENAYIDFTLADLNHDGQDDVVLYFGNDTDYPVVETFLSDFKAHQQFIDTGFFESYLRLNIAKNGYLQRIDTTGKVIDEVEITPEGPQVVAEH